MRICVHISTVIFSILHLQLVLKLILVRKISAIIPTFNEADNIAAAIESLEFCNEVMVVDSFSEDEKGEIYQKQIIKINN